MRISMLRTMDVQGRIVIPMEIRKALGIGDGETLEIETTGKDITLRKCDPFLPQEKQIQHFLSILNSVISCGAVVCTPEYILACKGISYAQYNPISASLSGYIKSGQEYILQDSVKVPVLEGRRELVSAIFPIISKEKEIPTLALVLLQRNSRPLSDMDLGSAKLVAATLGQHLEF